jgi:hypothetical protein
MNDRERGDEALAELQARQDEIAYLESEVTRLREAIADHGRAPYYEIQESRKRLLAALDPAENKP